jgi:hypothetical protein
VLIPTPATTPEPQSTLRSAHRAGDRAPEHPVAAPDDDALIVAVAAGDPAALDQAFERFRRDAFAAAFALLRDPHAAEDAVHDAFLRVWTCANSFQPERGGAKAWLLTIVRNKAIDRLRANLLARRRQSALIQVETAAPGRHRLGGDRGGGRPPPARGSAAFAASAASRRRTGVLC